MAYVIGSFNVQKMHLAVSTDETKKNYARIADIIKSERFDAVALQEVMTGNAVEWLVRHLGPSEWDYVFRQTKKTCGGNAQSEGYAFIWNKRRLELVKDSQTGLPANSSVEVKDEYSISQNRMGRFLHSDSLVRPPLVVRLTPRGKFGGAPFEIRLINTHIAFSSPANVIDKYPDRELRLMEFKVLAEEVYRRVSSKRYGDNLPAYTVLLGDYNLCLAGAGSSCMDEFVAIDERRNLRTVQWQKSSLKQTRNTYSNDELNLEHEADVMHDEDIDIYSQNYDHFSFDSSYESDLGIVFTASRVEALDNNYHSLEEYRREVSDHVPVKLTMSLKDRARR